MALDIVSKRQLQKFRSHKRGLWSLRLLCLLTLVSIFAPIVSNNKPIIMKFDDKLYFPVFEAITPTDLNLSTDFHQVDFRALSNESSYQWSLWPIVAFHPNESDRSLDSYPSAPDSAHWFGTDNRGRDVLARVIYGLRNALAYTTLVWFFSFLLGSFLGGIQGYFGGWFDFSVQRIIEVISSVPSFFLMIIVVSLIKPSLVILAVLSVLIGGWISISYYLRAEFLRLRNQEFVEAARAQGISRMRIILKHILPNALNPIITFTPFKLTAGITGLAGLDYLGFGLPPHSASWGELLNQAQQHIDSAWWLALFPSLALVMTLLLLNFVGEAAREAFDPRS
jgi:microcin C transport system permease protein